MSKNNLQAVADRAAAAAGAAAAPADNRRKAPGAKGREGTRMIAGHFPAEYQTKIRMIAAAEDRTVQSVMAEAFEDLFLKKKM